MDDVFEPEEKLYRAVYPPEMVSMFWRKDGTISSAAFADSKGLSVERGYYRQAENVVSSMLNRFSGIIISVNVGDCNSIQAVVYYLPSKTSLYHSEIHGSTTVPLLSKSQRLYLAKHALILR